MKIIGTVIVIGACLAIGQRKVNADGQELSTLNALISGVRVMRAELSGRLCPMEELLALAAEQTESEAGAFFQSCADSLSRLNEKSFSELWSEAGQSCLQTLSAENLSRLGLLGDSLGRYELEEQLAACDRYLRDAEEEANKLRAKLPEQRKISLALSAAAGVFICLLIL